MLYKAKYDWAKISLPFFSLFFDNLAKQSLSNWSKSLNNDNLSVSENKVLEMVFYAESYTSSLFNLHYIDIDNCDNALAIFKELSYINILPNNYKNIYGSTSNDHVSINPNIPSFKNLNSKQRTVLYLSHELTHFLHKRWDSKGENYCITLADWNNFLETYPSFSVKYDGFCEMVRNGFDFFDEVTSQNIAEDVAYYLSGKKRNKLKISSSKLFNGKPFLSNFDSCYREFQQPAMTFSKILLNPEDKKSDSLKIMSKMSLSPDFISQIENKFTEYGASSSFIPLLFFAGVIKDACYSKVGANTFADTESISADALSCFNGICNDILMRKYSKESLLDTKLVKTLLSKKATI